MSIDADLITCTGCDFETTDLHEPIRLIYQFPDGDDLSLGRQMGWCDECNNLRDIEPQLDVAEIRSDISRLQRELSSVLYRLKTAVGILLGHGGRHQDHQLLELKRQLAFAEGRRSPPRCLTCGSPRTRPVSFGQDGLSVNFMHHCGGRLRVAPDPSGIRLIFNDMVIRLDPEGHVLSRE